MVLGGQGERERRGVREGKEMKGVSKGRREGRERWEVEEVWKER